MHKPLLDSLNALVTARNAVHSLTPLHYAEVFRHAAALATSRNNAQPCIALEILRSTIDDADKGKIAMTPESSQSILTLGYADSDVLPSLLIDSPTLSQPMLSILSRHAATASNLEQLLLTLMKTFERRSQPSETVMNEFVRVAIEAGQPALAYDLASRFERNGGRLSPESWHLILMSSAENRYLSGVQTAWSRVVSTKNHLPDEGLILAVLATAARWGIPALAVDALDLLAKLGLKGQEHHLSFLIEAYVKSGSLPEAVRVLSSIRAAGIEPAESTTQPIVSALRDAQLIDEAFFALEDMHAAGTAPDIAALNAIIEAAVLIKDLPRARATQSAAKSLGLTPTLRTFNLILSACVSNRGLADKILSEMRACGLSPDVQTYETMINLCLTEDVYDDAFFHLEQMKAAGMKPGYRVYTALIKRCVSARDWRWKLLKEEGEALGYSFTRNA